MRTGPSLLLALVALLLATAALGGCVSPDPAVRDSDDAPSNGGSGGGDGGLASRSALNLTRLPGDFDQPLLVTHAGDGSGRLFVVEQGGRVLVGDGTSNDWAVFGDVGDRLATGGERGLLGLAFHPDFADNGVVLLSYTASGGGDSVLSRWRVAADGASLDGGSEEVLLRVAQPFANHNGGHVAFGPGGHAYWALGDGGAGGDPGGNGQNPQTLLGSILRVAIGPSGAYAAPHDNPFVGNVAGADEVWAYGLRNPWRFSFDRVDLGGTGDLWIADVGQDCVEEVNHQPAGSGGGENYGWNRFEGDRAYAVPAACVPASAEALAAGTVLPVAQYDLADGHCSVTGGHVIRDSALRGWAGAYLYGDYCSGTIWSLDGPGTDPVVLLNTDLRISSFGEDELGRVYVVDHQGAAWRLDAA